MTDTTTYLVTGIAGNLGSSVAAQLLADGRRVRGLVLPGDPAAERVPTGVELHTGDVTDRSSLTAAFAHVPGERLIVIHCAAVVTLDPGFNQLVHDVNVTGTANIIEACLANDAPRLIHVSSTGAIPEAPHGTPIGEPDHFDPDAVVGYYSKSKATASQLVLDAVRNRGLDATLVYPTGICGPDDHAFGPVTNFILDYCHGRLPAGIEGSFNAVDSRDLAAAIVTACERGRTGEGYVLANQQVTMPELFAMLSSLTGTPQVTRIVPTWAARLLGRGGDILQRISGKPTPLTSFAVYNLTRNNDFDTAKARRDLDYTTRPFGQTLSDSIDWLRREGLLDDLAA
ncbi:MAG: NAD-dependent epimerase/dehydratase family protein [Propionibacteriaceae bacterium]|nr:NAD-dependent epimerase/dehydratase family protein [Propionibacteriaceae bacterium]